MSGWEAWRDPVNPHVLWTIRAGGRTQQITEADVNRLADELAEDYGHKTRTGLPLARDMLCGAAMLGRDIRENFREVV